eukprot:Rhum_TRINITY_DN1017_c0_g1::Rhum_TRINITY_DN1017_c0_g1_i1::g.3100::m.3100
MEPRPRTKRKREEDGPPPSGENRAPASASDEKADAAGEWLSGVLSSSGYFVDTFVDLRGSCAHQTPESRNDAYKTFLEGVAAAEPEGAPKVATMDPDKCHALLRATALDLVESTPLVAATYMILEESRHTEVNAWAEDEKARRREQQSEEATGAGTDGQQDGGAGGETALEDKKSESEMAPRAKKVRQVKKDLAKDYYCTLPVGSQHPVRADSDDSAPVVRHVQHYDVVPVVADDICTRPGVAGAEQKWAKVADGCIKIEDGDQKFFEPFNHKSTYVMEPSLRTPTPELRRKVVRFVGQYIMCKPGASIAKVGCMASKTPISQLLRNTGGVKEYVSGKTADGDGSDGEGLFYLSDQPGLDNAYQVYVREGAELPDADPITDDGVLRAACMRRKEKEAEEKLAAAAAANPHDEEAQSHYELEVLLNQQARSRERGPKGAKGAKTNKALPGGEGQKAAAAASEPPAPAATIVPNEKSGKGDKGTKGDVGAKGASHRGKGKGKVGHSIDPPMFGPSASSHTPYDYAETASSYYCEPALAAEKGGFKRSSGGLGRKGSKRYAPSIPVANHRGASHHAHHSPVPPYQAAAPQLGPPGYVEPAVLPPSQTFQQPPPMMGVQYPPYPAEQHQPDYHTPPPFPHAQPQAYQQQGGYGPPPQQQQQQQQQQQPQPPPQQQGFPSPQQNYPQAPPSQHPNYPPQQGYPPQPFAPQPQASPYQSGPPQSYQPTPLAPLAPMY